MYLKFVTGRNEGDLGNALADELRDVTTNGVKFHSIGFGQDIPSASRTGGIMSTYYATFEIKETKLSECVSYDQYNDLISELKQMDWRVVGFFSGAERVNIQ